MAMPIDQAGSVEDLKGLLHQSEQRAGRLEAELAQLRRETDEAATRLTGELRKQQAAAADSALKKQMELIDVKLITPTGFDGTKLEHHIGWFS